MIATQTGNAVTGDVEIAAVVARAADFGFRLANFSELEAGVSLAASLTGNEIASARAVHSMNEVTGMTAWVTGDPVDGIFLTLPLSVAGQAAVLNGTYAPAGPDPAHLAKQGKGIAAFYVGVYAGLTREARKKIMMVSAVLRVEMFGGFPAYARGATEDGRRSMESLGFRQIEGGLPDLYAQDAFHPLPGRAA